MSTSTSISASPPTPPPLKILMLHGFTQTPLLFRHKTAALQKSLTKSFPRHHLHFSHVPGPHKLALADLGNYNPAALDAPAEEAPDAYGWWRRKDYDDGREVVYEGLEEGLGTVAKTIREEGPFDGVVGFSQGAAAAAMVASLLEGRGRREAFEKAEEGGGMKYLGSFLEEGVGGVDGLVQGPLKFAVCYSGFRAPGRKYTGFYEPKIRTPVLNVLGQLDVVVDVVRARHLVSACEGGEGRLVVHPGGHFVPSQKPWLDAVVGFVKECVEGKEVKREREDAKAEDMDVPF